MGRNDSTHIKPTVGRIPKALGHPTFQKKKIDHPSLHGIGIDNYYIPTPKIIHGQGPTMQSYPSEGKDSRSLKLPQRRHRRGIRIIPVESIIERSNQERPVYCVLVLHFLHFFSFPLFENLKMKRTISVGHENNFPYILDSLKRKLKSLQPPIGLEKVLLRYHQVGHLNL